MDQAYGVRFEGFCPFERARTLGLRVTTSEMPDGQLGYYEHREGLIVVSDALSWQRRRATVAHEVTHAERGDDEQVVRTLLDRREMERSVDEVAARRLIPLDALVDALAVGGRERDIADLLFVDSATVRSRIDTLTPAEQGYLSACCTQHRRLAS